MTDSGSCICILDTVRRSALIHVTCDDCAAFSDDRSYPGPSHKGDVTGDNTPPFARLGPLLLQRPPHMDVVQKLASTYRENPARIKAIDIFMTFLVALGALQFVFAGLVGNFPFNAFLGGFASTVVQFVLLAALRIQLNPANRNTFVASPQRAFGDFIGASILLHFLVLHFIN